jgi:hypothetical protein
MVAMTTAGLAAHWDEAYRHGDTTRSWFQQHPRPSQQLIESTGVNPADGIIDVGGGASTLVDALLDAGHTDITVLDISAEGLRTARRRLGQRSEAVRWLVADLLDWTPDRTWNIWHDRAVLHFFTTDTDRQHYVRSLNAATAPGSWALLGTFAADGPTHCSGLPVTRYDAQDLAELLGQHWQLIAHNGEQHTTPTGGTQHFTWTAFQRHQP